MAILLSFSKDGVFDPADLLAMSMAFDDVCKRLSLRDGPQRKVIAERIIGLARRGIRSSPILRDQVLNGVASRA